MHRTPCAASPAALVSYVCNECRPLQHTARGEAGHRRVDTAADRIERGHRILRHLPLWSERYALTGRADAVSIDTSGSVCPIEYKIGTRHGITAHLQLCAQALCLEEMFEQRLDDGYIWYSSTRRRQRVALDDALRTRTIDTINEIRRWMQSRVLPPAPDDRRCLQCQFLDYCQPHLTAHPGRVDQYIRTHLRCDS